MALAAALAGSLALLGCTPGQLVQEPFRTAPAAAPAPAPPTQTEQLAKYYRKVQAGLLSQGLMRTDMGGPDTPFNAQMLARNFLKIAFYEEYSGPNVVRKAAPIPLTRWNVPVRVSLRFGTSVSADTRAVDTARVSSYLARLAKLTGHKVGLANSDTNFSVFIADVDERALLGPELKQLLPGLTPVQSNSMTHLDLTTYCQVITESNPVTSTYTAAAAVIPSEHPALMLEACIHEELAQALGLPNDYALARPSIFNDDQEFALLTRQDELMLKMLYNPALKPGMTESEARPIVEALATKLMGDKTLP